ncbi:MAG: ferrochelatase [Acidimicrobiales bacterium]|jgi:ferrochelatase
MAASPVGVLIMAYGTPARPEDILAFYTDIRRGRPPTPEQLADLKRRYYAVGGTSQLAARTAEQVAGVQAALDAAAPGEYVCRFAAKHASPSIEDAVQAMALDGVKRVVGFVLAPHYSAGSVGEYLSRFERAAAAAAMSVGTVEGWHDHPVLIELLAERVRAAYASIGSDPTDPGIRLLVSAHSLPMRIIESGDGYDQRLHETAELVATNTGAARWQVCWQSAGRTPEPWIGPDVLEVLKALPAEGVAGAVVCPAGFTSDHLEVNYDLDIEANALAQDLGLRFTRTASLNADERLCAALAGLVSGAVPPAQ